jgi:cardiolipin synthase
MKLLESLAGEAFCRVADSQNSTGNHIRLLRDGTQTYPAWLAAIANARKTIDLENYIIQEDATGTAFADALIAAAARGVQCRVLYDWLGCLTRTTPKFWRRLREAGIEIACYNPPHLTSPLGWISRDHRKVLCIDDDLAFTGGLCIGHDWAGDPARNIPPWRDTAIEIRGPAATHIKAAFADSWQEAGGQPASVPLPSVPDMPGPDEGVKISLIAGRPNHMGLYRLEQLIAEIAERSLWLSDGYFVATTGYIQALTGAARAGVDVRLLVPGSSDWKLVGALSESAFRPLLQAGVRIFTWNGPMMHAKTAVADGSWTRIGSSNSNLASWISNRELDVTIHDATLAGEMEAMFEQDLQNATEIILTRGRTGVLRPQSASGEKFPRRRNISAGRLLSGAIGAGSTLTASFTQHRQLGPAEFLILLGGSAILLILALLGLWLPRLIAYPLAIIAIWFAVDLAIKGYKLRQSGQASAAGDAK